MKTIHYLARLAGTESGSERRACSSQSSQRPVLESTSAVLSPLHHSSKLLCTRSHTLPSHSPLSERPHTARPSPPRVTTLPIPDCPGASQQASHYRVSVPRCPCHAIAAHLLSQRAYTLELARQCSFLPHRKRQRQIQQQQQWKWCWFPSCWWSARREQQWCKCSHHCNCSSPPHAFQSAVQPSLCNAERCSGCKRRW